jgi:predicted Zn-dependent protease
MTYLDHRKSYLNLLLAFVLLVNLAFPVVASAFGATSASIEVEDFRWTRFPLKVLVDMNKWSTPDYAVAVHEALNSWLHSIWNYTNTYGAPNLPSIDYRFYMNTVNNTGNPDVLITFSPDEIPPGSGIVGLTSAQWDSSHTPVPPITINVTTYQKTIYTLFVKNVAMHEFGHVLGLGHATSQFTSNGPELMYPRSVKDQVTYPSTLDVYALTRLYQGDYGQQVQLPSSTIPYVMLSDGSVPPPSYLTWDTFLRDLIIIAIFLVALSIALIIWRTSKKPEQPPEPTPVEIRQNPPSALWFSMNRVEREG